LIALIGLSIGLAGCSHPDRGPAVPSADTTRALPLGIANARFFADGDPGPMIEEGTRALAREVATLHAAGKSTARLPPAYYLAVSGGGDNGAFGAGLMKGWTETGTRPEFKIVTGVSTGALIAPFAFLGPNHDAALREVYTTMTPDRVFVRRRLTAALFDDAMADTTPLAEIIAKYADQKMFDEIAREYDKGRLLLIGTTDLDAQRPVIWNIGALAASGHPKALDLYREILRASAAIPGAFQPVLIDVEIDGKKFQEMHVDGGAIAQLFLYPPSIELGRLGDKRERRAYIIRNARLDPDHATTERRTINIAGRAIAVMLASSGYNDVLRTYFVSRRDGVDYNLAYIGSDFTAPRAGEFDQAYMQALYDYGYRQAREGRAWRKVPPGLPAPQVSR
jgi:predicted patatin/cPLA2 family phospholipase